MWDPTARNGSGAHDVAGVVVELVEPDQQEIGECDRERVRPHLGGLDELLGEEGVAFGPLDDAADGPLRERLGVQRPHQRADVGVGQAPQLDPADPGESGPLRGRGTQWVAAVQVVAAVGHDHGHGCVETAREQEAQHLASGAVGPVDVLHHQQERG